MSTRTVRTYADIYLYTLLKDMLKDIVANAEKEKAEIDL
jgi:hypothetical protein